MKASSQSSEVIILGAGASASFTPIEYPFKGTLVPFPMANDFFEKAIKYNILKDRNVLGQPLHRLLLDFIQNNFGLSFEDLKMSKLSVEEVYAKLDISIGKLNKSKDISEEELNLYLAKQDLLKIIEELLSKLCRYYGPCKHHAILAKYIVEKESVVISFNWDTLMDSALQNSNEWFYETGYGIKFQRVYINKKEISEGMRRSKGLLLKPHGSTNWFRYQDFYWSDTNGFTCEPVSKKEMEETFLFEFLKGEPPRIHPIHMRLNLGKNYAPLLKMPVEIDIIPPVLLGKRTKLMERPAFKTIWDKANAAIKKAGRIIAIGYALKETYIESNFNRARKGSNSPLLLTLVNRSIDDPKFLKLYKKVFNPDSIEVFHSFEDFCETLSF